MPDVAKKNRVKQALLSGARDTRASAVQEGAGIADGPATLAKLTPPKPEPTPAPKPEPPEQEQPKRVSVEHYDRATNGEKRRLGNYVILQAGRPPEDFAEVRLLGRFRNG